MNKFILVFVFIILGAFTIFMISSKTNQNKSSENNFLPTITSIPTPPTSSQNETNTIITTLKTSKGNIVLELYLSKAPKTIENFIQKAKNGFYANKIFHRVEDWVIQGGDPLGNGTGGGSMPVEFNNKPFIIGSVGVASRGDGKVQNDAQFFITKMDASWLNGQYTNFGIVKEGIDIVNKIEIGDKILEINVK